MLVPLISCPSWSAFVSLPLQHFAFLTLQVKVIIKPFKKSKIIKFPVITFWPLHFCSRAFGTSPTFSFPFKHTRLCRFLPPPFRLWNTIPPTSGRGVHSAGATPGPFYRPPGLVLKYTHVQGRGRACLIGRENVGPRNSRDCLRPPK